MRVTSISLTTPDMTRLIPAPLFERARCSEESSDLTSLTAVRVWIHDMVQLFLAHIRDNEEALLVIRTTQGAISFSRSVMDISRWELPGIPDNLSDIGAEYFPYNADAFKAFLEGRTVLIKHASGRVLLRWDPFLPDVFAA